MALEAWVMMGAGVAALIAGLAMVRCRWRVAEGLGRLLVLGPVFEAVALAIFAAEHFTAARALAGIVPRWLPGALFWTYFFGVALLAAATSFVLWRFVRWSAVLLALFFGLIVATVDVPQLLQHPHQRLFWILAVREAAFAGGAMALAGSVGPLGPMSKGLAVVGRSVVACAFVFYAIEHFLFPRHVPGVPLEKLTPGWVPTPALLGYGVGVVLLLAGVGLLARPSREAASASAGFVLLLLTAFLYVPILATEIRSPLVIEGVNYVGDTLLFAATALLAGAEFVHANAGTTRLKKGSIRA